MMNYLALLVLAVICHNGVNGVRDDVLRIDTTTSYVNAQVEVLAHPGDNLTFVAPTCNYYDSGYKVTVRVYNPHNPSNDLRVGVTYFIVSNKPFDGGVVSAADTICAVYSNTTNYVTECTGVSKPGNVYVLVTGNNRRNINFALTVSFDKSSSSDKIDDVGKYDVQLPRGTVPVPLELRQVVNYDRRIPLPYLNETVIHLRFCPYKLTGHNFRVQSILQADDADAKSVISQAMCTVKDCTFDTKKPDRIGENFDDLPVSVVRSDCGHYNDMYVYGVAYNGPKVNGYPVGSFRFAATLTAC